MGEYLVGKQIGTGSYSTVWHARHRVHGTEVAIKEIATARLNSKLKESLMSEIVILQKINHPNIIHLHDMIQDSGKVYIVLEYCQGGDLSMFIQQRNGRISEATAKHFMQQLASGLKALRENNLIHRDLKPQNLLLSVNSDNAVLKIADFGFARSLQPRGLAETLCGSPLYMAPEIMQLQKYDAKADLWSVGAILFQLVTGRTPFIGNNQIQLLQNIVKSSELQFPSNAKNLSDECIDLCKKLLRRNPVERLTFEEFFNHQFLAKQAPEEQSKEMRIWKPERKMDGFPLPDEDCLPFKLDDDSTGAQSLELIDQSYVFVSSPPIDSSSSSSPLMNSRPSAPVPIIPHQASTQSMKRMESLQQFAAAIAELVTEKSLAGRHLEAFSIQLVNLAIWKQALHICHAQAASASSSMEGTTTTTTTTPTQNIEKSFLHQVEDAEELSKFIEPGNSDVPDAMEMIFQSALDLGRKGAVDEYMGRTENAVVFYSKAVQLLTFLQVEASSLILSPPFTLTNSDRFRLQSYIDVLKNRQSVSRSQIMALLS